MQLNEITCRTRIERVYKSHKNHMDENKNKKKTVRFTSKRINVKQNINTKDGMKEYKRYHFHLR